MAGRLLNVRLTPEDELIAKQLRKRGVSLSEIVRRALRDAADDIAGIPLDPVEFEAEMTRLHPTPKNAKSARPDTLDRHAVRAHIRAKLRGRQ